MIAAPAFSASDMVDAWRSALAVMVMIVVEAKTQEKNEEKKNKKKEKKN